MSSSSTCDDNGDGHVCSSVARVRRGDLLEVRRLALGSTAKEVLIVEAVVDDDSLPHLGCLGTFSTLLESNNGESDVAHEVSTLFDAARQPKRVTSPMGPLRRRLNTLRWRLCIA
eukprot:scaffold34476_cov188-Skeletonema_menzelii.AAC.2